VSLLDTLKVPAISDVAEVAVSYQDALDETTAPILYSIVRPPSSSARVSFFAMHASNVEKDEHSRVKRMTTNGLSARSIASIAGRVATIAKVDKSQIRVFVGVLRDTVNGSCMYLAEVK
jgi:hypothetical protein